MFLTPAAHEQYLKDLAMTKVVVATLRMDPTWSSWGSRAQMARHETKCMLYALSPPKFGPGPPDSLPRETKRIKT